MLKLTAFISIIFFTTLIQAAEAPAFYQIDLIIFTHQQSPLSKELSLNSTLSSGQIKTIHLETDISKTLSPYHLLPPSSSQLREEYWALHRRPQYQVLVNYTWLQPLNSKLPISLPHIQRNGWELEGSLNIQRANYYVLNSELLFTTPDSQQAPFVLRQKLRLKGGDIYYFDHPQAGMLIKIHQLVG